MIPQLVPVVYTSGSSLIISHCQDINTVYSKVGDLKSNINDFLVRTSRRNLSEKLVCFYHV